LGACFPFVSFGRLESHLSSIYLRPWNRASIMKPTNEPQSTLLFLAYSITFSSTTIDFHIQRIFPLLISFTHHRPQSTLHGFRRTDCLSSLFIFLGAYHSIPSRFCSSHYITIVPSIIIDASPPNDPRCIFRAVALLFRTHCFPVSR
jgi:hypothetical protein